MTTSSTSRSFTFIGVMVLAVVATGAGLYMLAYRPWRETYFRQSRLRQLAVFAEQARGAVSSRLWALQNAVDEYLDDHKTATGPDADEWLAKPLNAAKLKRVDCRELDFAEGPTPGSQPPSQQVAFTRNGRANLVQTDQVSLGHATAESSTSVRCDALAIFGYHPESGHASATRVCAQVLLSTLFDPFLKDGSFDGVDLFIARDGEVLYERGQGSLRLGDLYGVQGAGGGAAKKDDAKKDDAKDPGAAKSGASAFPEWKELAATTVFRRDLPVGGEQYVLLSHPLLVQGQTTSKWVVGMLVPGARFESDVASLSFGSVSGVPLVLLLLLLAAPVLKVWAMGPRDRFTRLDARLLLVSLLAFGGVTVALALGSYSYLQLERTLDTDLQQLSVDIRSRFRDELQMAGLSLHTFLEGQVLRSSNAPQARRSDHSEANLQPRRVVELFGSCTSPDSADCCPAGAGKAATRAGGVVRSEKCPLQRNGTADIEAGAVVNAMWRQYRYIDAVAWSDGKNRPQERWTTKETAPRAAGSRGEQQWMTDLRDGRVWGVKAYLHPPQAGESARPASQDSFQPGASQPLPSAADGDSNEGSLLLHVMIFPNTGLPVPILAMGDRHDDQLTVAAHMAPELMSVNQPVLPDGFGFAMIQNDGRVVFHSNYTRSLYENFFDECDAAAEVRAMIEAGSTRFFDGYYRGRKHRLYVHAVEGSPWSLIVFRDKELPRTAELDALMSWFVMFLAYVGLFALAQTLVRCFAPPDEGEWYWPDANGRARYEDCAFILAVNTTAIAAAIARRAEPSGLVLIAVMALVLASGAFVYLRLAPSRQGGLAAGRRVRRLLAVLALGAAALALWWLFADRVLAGILLAAGSATLVALASAQRNPVGSLRESWLLLALAASLCWIVSIADARFVMSFALFLLAAFAWVTAFRVTAPGRAWRTPYIAAAVLFIALAGILPSVMFYQDAFDVSMGVFVRHGEEKLAEALEKRDLRIHCNYREKADGSLIKPRLQETRDVYLSALFGGPKEFCPESRQSGGSESDTQSGALVQLETWLRDNGLGLDPSPEPWGRTAFAAGGDSQQGRQEEPVCAGWFAWLRHFVSDAHFSAPILAELPVYHAESVATRGFVQTQTDGQEWIWTERDDHSELKWRKLNGSPGETIDGWKELPSRSKVMSPKEWGVLLALVAVAGLITWATVRWLAQRLLGMGETIVPAHEGSGVVTARGALLLGDFEGMAATAPNVALIDLAADRPLDGEAAAVSPSWTMALHLERRLENLDLLKDGLTLVQNLMDRPEPVFLVSKVDPLAYFRRRIQSTWDTAATQHLRPEVVASWARVLEQAMRLPLPSAGSHPRELLERGLPTDPGAWCIWRASAQPADDAWPPERIDELWEECSWTCRLRGIAWEVWGCNPAPAGRDEVVALVREAAAAHYRAQWSLLTDPEQLILVQLAQEGFVNPTEKSWRILGRLAQRGFVRFTPAARLANDSFHQFVLSEETDEKVRDWEKADGASWWDSARDGIVYVLMAGGVFLYLTHPDDVNGMAGILGAISGATGKVAGWFDLWGVSKSSQPAAKAEST